MSVFVTPRPCDRTTCSNPVTSSAELLQDVNLSSNYRHCIPSCCLNRLLFSAATVSTHHFVFIFRFFCESVCKDKSLFFCFMTILHMLDFIFSCGFMIIVRRGIRLIIVTRLHSSRMRTARALTVSPSMLCGCGCLLPGGEGGDCSIGVSVLGGGGVAPGGLCSQGVVVVVSQHALKQTHLPLERNHRKHNLAPASLRAVISCFVSYA